MKKRLLKMAVACASVVSFSVPASAQMAVIDARAIAQALQTARNTMQQLQEAQKLYTAMNSISNIRSVSNLLDNPMLRSALPDGMQSTVDLASADLRDLGAIGSRAESIMSQRDFSFGAVDQALGDAQGMVRKAATLSARDQAYSERMLEATEATGNGLQQLNSGLSSATTLRQAQDIAARAAIENAGVNNRMLQMMAAEQAARGAAALRSSERFAAGQRAEADALANGSDRPTWNGQQ
jgi:hypothetical protein